MSGKTKKIGTIDFKKFVDIFNTRGKNAAVEHVAETYGVKYDSIVNRLRRESEYMYNTQKSRYMLKSDVNDDVPFLNMEQLCRNEKTKVQDASRTEQIIANLIKDNFLEMSKFMSLEISNKKIILKIDAARQEGYTIEYL